MCKKINSKKDLVSINSPSEMSKAINQLAKNKGMTTESHWNGRHEVTEFKKDGKFIGTNCIPYHTNDLHPGTKGSIIRAVVGLGLISSLLISILVIFHPLFI